MRRLLLAAVAAAIFLPFTARAQYASPVGDAALASSGGGGGSTFTSLGTFKSGTQAATTFAIPISAGEASGKSVVVAIGMQTNGGALTVSGCTDNASVPNTYNIDAQTNNTTDGYVSVLVTSNISSSIPSTTGTITCTISGTTTTILISGAWDVASPQFSSGTFLDGTAGTFHTQGASSGTATASTATANDIAITAWTYKTSDTLTVTTGYTQLPLSPLTQTGRGLYVGAKLVSSGGAVAATGALSAADDVVGVVAGYKHP